jgi:chromosome segregation ATPase
MMKSGLFRVVRPTRPARTDQAASRIVFGRWPVPGTRFNPGGAMNRAELEQELALLTAELAEREAALPAHSVRPHQLQAVMDLEERIEDLQRQLAAAEDQWKGDQGS